MSLFRKFTKLFQDGTEPGNRRFHFDNILTGGALCSCGLEEVVRILAGVINF
jgi:hypothetical protein